MGPWVVALTMAPMPARLYAPWAAVTCGKSVCIRKPNAPPAIAPMNSDGANTPPELPEPMVTEVVRILMATRLEREARDLPQKRKGDAIVSHPIDVGDEDPDTTDHGPSNGGLRIGRYPDGVGRSSHL